MAEIRSFAVQYANVDYAQVAASPYQLFITEGAPLPRPGSTPALTDPQVAALIAQGRYVAGYVNVAVTDDNRSYWNPAWTSTGGDLGAPVAGAPAWLTGQPTNDFGRIVKFWDPEWTAIVVAQAVSLVKDHHYNAVFLDDVGAYFNLIGLAGQPSSAELAQRMIALVDAVSDAIKAIDSKALVIVNGDPFIGGNAGGGAWSKTFTDAIDAMVLENPWPATLPAAKTSIAPTDPVLVISSNNEHSAQYYYDQGMVPYISPTANYDQLGPYVGAQTSGADHLIGGDGPDQLSGEGGDDHLEGKKGSDTLDGGEGNDLLDGGSNDYVAETGLGRDILRGGAGDDRLIRVAAGDTADGGAGIDWVEVDLRFTHVPWVAGTLLSTSNTNGLTVDLAAASVTLAPSGLDPATVLTNIERFTIVFGSGADIVHGGAYNDDLDGDSYNFPGGDDELHGRGGDDDLYGAVGADRLYGDEGDDRLNGGEASPGYNDYTADELHGGAGDDLLIGHDRDFMDGGDGYDTAEITFQGATANYVIDFEKITGGGPLYTLVDGTRFLGVEKITSLEAGKGSDLIHGDAQNNVIYGGSGTDADGDDELHGRDGDDRLYGDNDHYLGADGNDRLFGDAGADKLYGGGGDDWLRGGTGDDDLDGQEGWDAADYGDAGAGVTVSLATTARQATGGAGGDRLTHFEQLTGGAFGDRLTGDAGANILEGAGGDDVLQGGAGSDQLRGGAGVDTASYADATAGVRIDLAAGKVDDASGTWTDTLSGVESAVGSAHADTLAGGAGANVLTGGAGADTFRYLAATDSTPDAYDIIADFQAGTDVLDLKGVAATEVSLVRSGATTFVFVATPGGSMTIAVNGDIRGGDIQTQGGRGTYVIGDGAANSLAGGATGDVIQAGAGDDTIIGGGGGDVLFGQAGADTFKYLAAGDSNAAGPDGLYGFETGVDRIDLTAAAPTEVSLIRSGGSTFLFANTPGGPMQLATVGYDLNAGDLVTGLSRGVFMIGDETANTLVGGALNDVIQAGAGADTVRGAGGGDALWGGAGADVFKYTAAADSGGTGNDSIFDFQAGIDKLDLTGVRTGASDVHGVLSSGGSTFVFVDLGGDGVGDMTIQLTNTASIQASDILF